MALFVFFRLLLLTIKRDFCCTEFLLMLLFDTLYSLVISIQRGPLIFL